MKIDLHIHSTASDGKLNPQKIIDYAIKNKIKAIAITDHDTIDGIKQAIDYSKDKNIEFIPGIEFSANPEDLAKEIHIVGLFIDYNNPKINDLINRQKEFGMKTSKKIIKKLNDLGYKISFEELITEFKREHFGRPIIAQLLMKKYPKFKDRKQVFKELLGKEGLAFVKNESSSISEIIATIHLGKGIAILAHPAYLLDNDLKVINEFIKQGGEGIEVDCPYESFGDRAELLREKYRKIATDNNLIISGGTDFHEEKAVLNIGHFGITNKEFKNILDYVKSKNPL